METLALPTPPNGPCPGAPALPAACVAAAYGWGTGQAARAWLATGRHRRYADERSRPVPTYRALPAVLAVAAAVLAARLGPAGVAAAAAYVVPVPLYGVLAAVDLDVRRLPDPLTLGAYPIVACVLAPATLAAPAPGMTARRAALAAVVSVGFFAVLHLSNRAGFGLGDVKLAGTLGALLGWCSWDRVLAGTYAMFLLAGGVAVVLLALRRLGRRDRMAFGPAMILGAAAVVVGGGAP